MQESKCKLLSLGNSSDNPNKNRIKNFSEKKSSLQGGTAEKMSSFELIFTESLLCARIC